MNKVKKGSTTNHVHEKKRILLRKKRRYMTVLKEIYEKKKAWIIKHITQSVSPSKNKSKNE